MTNETQVEAIRELVAVLEEFDEWAEEHAGMWVWEMDEKEYLGDDYGWKTLIARAKAALKKAGAL